MAANGNYVQHSITILCICVFGSSNEVMIDGVIITNKFDSSGFVIPSTQAVSTQTSYVLEYGSGTLNGNELRVNYTKTIMMLRRIL